MTEVREGLVIVGMGNPLLSDDGAGHHAARDLGSAFPGATVHTVPVIGMDLLDLIMGFHTLCLVDAMTTGTVLIGTVKRFPLPGPSLHTCSSHGPDLQSVLSLGQALGLDMPPTVLLYGIEIGTEIPYGEDLTPALKLCFKGAIQHISADMRTRLQAVLNR